MFNLDDCMAFITSRSAKIFSETMEQRLSPYSITRPQWVAIYYIYTSNSITQRVLADKMSVKEPTVVRLIQKMEQEGLLTRFGIAGDKRVKQLHLTKKGTNLYHELLPVAEKFMNDTIEGISKENLQILKDTLSMMVYNALKKRSQ
ncbi:MarR family winged helix-turn-helix transcriptional regulator [Clostridium sp. MT-14]|uniref:MarR family transcriptional regulator n=1 Tax=Clostridium aromativorans TaxID=2836848 RepID=A0ABS8NAC7_9CLOT|nr:MarR family transcriptional regulator [Clostridium aromativorans]MCC9296743.1 MarR family transcriptional regulator [Clostridium aromativorans]HBC96136.1 MarR family transcriptional regulator [Clostridium sp.]